MSKKKFIINRIWDFTITAVFLFSMFVLAGAENQGDFRKAETIYDFSARTIDGELKSLADFKGKVVLIVNTASECGFTPQYQGLEELSRKYREQGLVVLGFPCNQFGNQEAGSNVEIKEFCRVNYNITFLMFEKIEVNGENAHPLFNFLKDNAQGLLGSKSIKWNFTKFLIDREGKVVERFSSQTKPEEIKEGIEKLL